MSRCITHPPGLPSDLLREVIYHASHYEHHLRTGDYSRKQALDHLAVVARALAAEHPEHLSRLWFNITIKKVYGRHLVIWGVTEQPRLADTPG